MRKICFILFFIFTFGDSYSQNYFQSKNEAIEYLDTLFNKSFNKATVYRQSKDQFGRMEKSDPLRFNFEFTQNSLIIYRATYSDYAAKKKWRWTNLTWYILPYTNIKEVIADKNGDSFVNSSFLYIDNVCRCFKKGYGKQKIEELEEFRISDSQRAEELLESGIDIPFDLSGANLQSKLSNAFLALRLPHIYTSPSPYDSLTNGITDTSKIYEYIGQTFYLSPSQREKNSGGYFQLFYTSPEFSGEANDRDFNFLYRKASSDDQVDNDYSSLQGTLFKVLGIAKNKNGSYFIQLLNERLKEICYYKYIPRSEIAFPFVVQGFFIKLKENLITKEFKTTGESWREQGIKDEKSGKIISVAKNKLWKVSDIYSAGDNRNDPPGLLVELTNKNGERITIPLVFFNSIYLSNP